MVPLREPAFIAQVEITIAGNSISAFVGLWHSQCEGRQSLLGKDDLVAMLAAPEDHFSGFVHFSVPVLVFLSQCQCVGNQPKKILVRIAHPDSTWVLVMRPAIGRTAILEGGTEHLRRLEWHLDHMLVALHLRCFNGILAKHKDVHPAFPFWSRFRSAASIAP